MLSTELWQCVEEAKRCVGDDGWDSSYFPHRLDRRISVYGRRHKDSKFYTVALTLQIIRSDAVTLHQPGVALSFEKETWPQWYYDLLLFSFAACGSL